MSLNLVDLVKQHVSSGVTSQIASALGEDAGATQSAVDGAIPSILGGLVSSSGSEEGRGLIGKMLDSQDTSMLDNLTGSLGGGNHQSLVTQGASILSGIFGGNSAVGGLAGALSRFSGLGSGSATSLISMLAPIVMGVLRRQKDESNLDAGGMFQMLSDQRSNITNAIPAQFQTQLGDAGILDRMTGGLTSGISGVAGAATGAVAGLAGAATGAAANVAGAAQNTVSGLADSAGDAISGAAGAAGDAASGAVSAASNAVGNVADGVTGAAGNAADAVTGGAAAAMDSGQQAVKSGGSMLGKLIPIAIVLAGVFLVWKFFLSGNAEMPDVADVTKVAGAEVNVSEQLTGVFSNATGALEGITDVDTANAALPKLQAVGTAVEGLSGTFDSLPEAVSGPAKSLIGDKLSGLQGLVEKITAIPGVGDIIQPVIAPIMNALASMGG